MSGQMWPPLQGHTEAHELCLHLTVVEAKWGGTKYGNGALGMSIQNVMFLKVYRY